VPLISLPILNSMVSCLLIHRVRGCTRIAQAVESQKTIIEYNGGPASPGPHRVLYTDAQDSGPLCHSKPSPERVTPSSRTTHSSRPEGWRATRRFLPIGSARAGAGGRLGSSKALARCETRLRLGAIQAISKGLPCHTSIFHCNSVGIAYAICQKIRIKYCIILVPINIIIDCQGGFAPGVIQ
jgi:hypothetical protein